MKRILIAEDEEILRMLIMDTLEEEDYAVDEAPDGEEALELLQKNQYDLLILDYMMPIVTGIEVIKKIRQDMKDYQQKILMLSAKSQSFEQEKVLNAGADYFMAKPFSPLALLAKVKEIFNED